MKPPSLLLGTAMWGWTISRQTAFALLDAFYREGLREVDAAVNYPINKNPADFRASENILIDWIQAHGISDLKITMKVGSLNNLRTPGHNLTKSFLLLNLDDYRYRLGANLDTFMIHWDNREDEALIGETLEALAVAREQGLRAGLSGIRRPDIYAKLNTLPEFNFDFRIQIKHNILQSDYARYAPFHGKRRFVAYGIHAGGIKLNPAEYRPDSSLRARGGDPENIPQAIARLREWMAADPGVPGFHRLAMIFAAFSPGMEGIIIGPSALEQLKQSIADWHSLDQEKDKSWFQRLESIT